MCILVFACIDVFRFFLVLWLRSSMWFALRILCMFRTEVRRRLTVILFPLAFHHLLKSTPITAAFWWVRYAHHHLWSHLTGTRVPWLLSDMISLTTCRTPSCMETDVMFAAVTHVLVGRMLLHISITFSSKV